MLKNFSGNRNIREQQEGKVETREFAGLFFLKVSLYEGVQCQD